MRFERLRLTGFKSFVEPAEFRIDPGLTGIVGPNGCGKSNLLEALRWVMGEASPRSLRGGGMEDVIFAGSERRPARSFAEVQLSAHDESRDEALEVVRRIERGAGSAYRLNGSDVRGRDVALLFADAATGAHSPALVSQGRVAALIAAKPAERRAMFEEAAGIAGLHVRRKDAEGKLRAAEANLDRLGEILATTEARTTALRRQARAADRYRALGEAIGIAEARLLYARWRDAAAVADRAASDADARDAAVSAAEAERDRCGVAREAALVLTRHAAAHATDTRAAEAAAALRLATLTAEQQAAARRLADLRARRSSLAADLVREQRIAEDADAALARLAEEDRALAAMIATGEEKLADLVRERVVAETAAAEAERAVAGLTARQIEEGAERRVAEAALAAVERRVARSAAARARLAEDERRTGDLEPARRDAAAAALDLDGAAAARSDAIAAAGDAEVQREAAAAGRTAAEAKDSVARAALAAGEAEARALVAALDRTKGARGLLADQVRAEPGWERALAAALGDALALPLGDEGWAGADVQPGDPALPGGAEPLARHVAAPPALARRLAQVGVVDRDDGAALAAGQRIVTRDGRMRRWDGLRVPAGAGAAAAERLVRINRLAALEAVLADAKRTAEAAAAAVDAARGELAAATAAVGAAQARLADCDRQQRAAARDVDLAAAAIARIEAAVAALTDRRREIVAEAGDEAAEQAAARAAVAALPDPHAHASALADAHALGERTKAVLARARTGEADAARRLAADRERHRAGTSDAGAWAVRADDAVRRIAEAKMRLADATAEPEPAMLDEAIAAARADADAARAAVGVTERSERDAARALNDADRALAEAGEAVGQAREGRAAAAARAEHEEARRTELGRISGERFGCPAPVLPERIGFAGAEVRSAPDESEAHARLLADRERLGPVNLVAAAELAELDAQIARDAAERDELTQAVNRLRGSIGGLNREGRERLRTAFEAIDGHFRRLVRGSLRRGRAHLALIDSSDPLEAGVEIFAEPPGKKLAALTLLSGGEQALTAIALVFAMFLTSPAPICVLDEVDAPLDDANVERFCDLLDRMTAETATRYLIVTHNAVTMSRMDRLFGVTMVERGVSRLVSVDLRAAEALAAE